MITPNYKQVELSALWAAAMSLHRSMRLGSKVTRSQQRDIAEICEQLLAIQTDLKKCRVYVPENRIDNYHPTKGHGFNPKVPTPTTDPFGAA